MKKLLIATRNKNKLPEIQTELSGLPVEIVCLDDLPDLPADFEVEETGNTFKANAIAKATQYGQKTGLLTLADDSGLCVDALGGRPGVYSARYASGTSGDRNAKLLAEMIDVPENKRTARYIAVIAIYDPDTTIIKTCEGICEGKITTQPLGTGGFGYDPVFFNLDLLKTTAEMSMAEKNSISHRGRALRQARQILAREFILNK